MDSLLGHVTHGVKHIDPTTEHDGHTGPVIPKGVILVYVVVAEHEVQPVAQVVGTYVTSDR